ncbi:hypothetical protein DOY81_005996 [Sarcophaga bullata]|nr:hypothetical protein DOY81_005996 [Sarcophaga bullata]
MKQKQVKAAPKNAKQTNLKKAAPPKKVAAPVEEEKDEEEEEVVPVKKPANKKAATVQKKVPPSKKVAAPVEEKKKEVVEKKVVAVKKPANKKAAAVQKKVVEVVEEPEEEEVDEEEEEDDEVEEDEEMDAMEDQEEQHEEMEAMEEDGDEQDDDDEAEDDDLEAEAEDDDDEAEEEQDDDEDDDDEGPTEAPIDEEPTIPSKVKSGEIPATVPLNKIVHITKLPKKCKQIDIVEAFAKFGAIDQIHLVVTPTGTVANVAFKTAKAANAATAASRKIKVIDSPVEVTAKKPRKDKEEIDKTDKFGVKESRQRTVYVKYLKLHTTEDQVREHFAGCGEIERCKVVSKSKITFSYVTFTEKESVKSALKLHNSVLNGGTVAVYECKPDKIVPLGQRDQKLIIMLRNKQHLEALEGATLEKIFSKCGQIDHMEVVCGKNILAFIVFKNEQAVEKALELNGKTEEGVELEVEKYDGNKKKTCIHVSNIHPSCTLEDLKNHFSVAGEFKSVILRKGFAIIYFQDTDGYCKSFLLDESYIKKQMIFVEPLSARKQTLLKARMAKLLVANMTNRKRPFQNGTSVFKGKKAKME